jgi:two-component system sensor histidine kinase UhpB
MDLPRAVMRGAFAVVALALLLGLVFGLWRARSDMRDELAGALQLARTSSVLAAASMQSDEALLAALRTASDSAEPTSLTPGAGDGMASRHLALRLTDGEGRVRFAPPAEPPAPAWMTALSAVNARLFPPPADRSVSISLPRPEGPPWQAQWVASHDYEQSEAFAQLLESMLLLAACSAVLLLVMRWRMQRAFRPLAPLLAAIGRVERQDLSALRALPPMPFRELEAIAGALRHLGGALGEAEAQRRQLAAQMQTLQEDERSRLARELHDELGQQLTALRVDAAWLERRLVDLPELRTVVSGMAQQCERVQAEVRSLLGRLRPLGTAIGVEGHATAATHESAERLRGLLASLVAAWEQSPGPATSFELRFDVEGLPWDVALPRELVLAVYRISQEALTNVARHAQAREAVLTVRLARAPHVEAAVLDWRVEDDGVGLDHGAAWQRGNGLAGIKERIWAAGGDLTIESVGEGTRKGLRLHASLPVALQAGSPLRIVTA